MGEAGGKSVARSSVPEGGDSKNGLGGEDKSNTRYAGIQDTSFIQTITDEWVFKLAIGNRQLKITMRWTG